MRHGKKFNHLGRKKAHRKAMLANMATSLILHKRIKTTVAKAKALKLYVEPLITKSKNDTTHSRRVVFSYLKDKYAVTELFRDISVKVADRPGGYTRILRTGNRLGDNAEMCIIELVDYNENMLSTKETKTKSTRRRKTKKKVDSTPKTTDTNVEVKKEVKSTEKKEEEPKAKKVKEVKSEKTEEKKPKTKKVTPKNEKTEKSDDKKSEEDTK